ncbi:hypothetical protein HDV02_002133 [Globomyces sp. JEL0801]|nr:hypothetical protein HDV02_002133 [Globomyces sp. JEL0801]
MLQSILNIVKQHKLTSSDTVNEELSKVIALLLNEYIASWYSLISPDEELYKVLVKSITTLLTQIERKLSRVEYVELLGYHLPIVLSNHIRDHRNCCSKVGTTYSGGKSFDQLFYGAQPHVALQSPEAEAEYMRRVSQILLDAMLPELDLQSDTVRLLFREIVCNNALAPELLDVRASCSSKSSDQSDLYYSDASNYLSDSPNISPELHDSFSPMASPSLTHSDLQTNHRSLDSHTIVSEESNLFKAKVRKSASFLSRNRNKPEHQANPLNLNSFTQKFTGGLGKMTSKIDKIKDFVTKDFQHDAKSPEKKSRHRKPKVYVNDEMLEDFKGSPNGDFLGSDLDSTPASKLSFDADIDATESIASANFRQGIYSPKANSSSNNHRTIIYPDPLLTNSEFSPQSEQISGMSHDDEVNSIHESIETEKPANKGKGHPKRQGSTTSFISASHTKLQESNTLSTTRFPFVDTIKAYLTNLYEAIMLVIMMLWNLYSETRKGPWKLGPIHTNVYERYNLEEPFLDLINEILEFSPHQQWLYTQFRCFVQPTIRAFAGPMINRYHLKLID